jgi:putative N6-adenine-specific DNA methylase
VAKYIDLQLKQLSQWTEAPAGGVLVTNPPYGERLRPADLDALYALLGEKLKHVFTGYHAWIIGYRDENFQNIGLAPSSKESLLNGSLECELREFVIFDGAMREFRKQGGVLKTKRPEGEAPKKRSFGSERKKRPFDGKKRRFDRERDDSAEDSETTAAATPREGHADNPLAARRNPDALKSIVGKKPSILTHRRGWRKPDGGTDTPAKES